MITSPNHTFLPPELMEPSDLQKGQTAPRWHESFGSEDSTVVSDMDDGVDDSSACTIKTSSTSEKVRMEPSPSSLLLLGDDPSHDSDDDSRNGHLNFDSTGLNSLRTKAHTVTPSCFQDDLDQSLTYKDYYGESMEREHSLVLPQAKSRKQKLHEFTVKQQTSVTPKTFTVPSQYTGTVNDSRQRMAAFRPMSVARLETALDTIIKAGEAAECGDNPRYTTLNNGSRLSFGYVLKQDFDKAAPACQILEGCLERMDEWYKTSGRSFEDIESIKDAATTVSASSKSSSKPKVLKSILKKVKRRFGNYRRSFFDDQQVKSNAAPKCPGRRGSFEASSPLEPPAPRRGSFFGSTTSTATTSTVVVSNEEKRKSGRKGRDVPAELPRRRGSFLSGWGNSNNSNKITAQPPNPNKEAPNKAHKKPQRRRSWLGVDTTQTGSTSNQDKTPNPPARRRRSLLGLDGGSSHASSSLTQNSEHSTGVMHEEGSVSQVKDKPRRRRSFLGLLG